MPRPNLFIIGAVRSGTTYLYQVLRSHPDVFMSPVKEPRHFITEISRTHDEVDTPNPISAKKKSNSNFIHECHIVNRNEYFRLFKNASSRYIGEASPQYLTYPSSLKTISEVCSDPKIIVSLRNPALRAFSHCSGDKAKGLFKKDPSERLTQDLLMSQNTSIDKSKYIKYSVYYPGLRAAIDIFGEENVLVLIFERWVSNKERLRRGLTSFLDVKETGFNLEVKTENKGFTARFKNLNYIVNRLGMKGIIRSYVPNKIVRIAKKLYYKERTKNINIDLYNSINNFLEKDTAAVESAINSSIPEWK